MKSSGSTYFPKFHFYFLCFMLFRPILKELGKYVLCNIYTSFFSFGEKMLGRKSQHRERERDDLLSLGWIICLVYLVNLLPFFL